MKSRILIFSAILTIAAFACNNPKAPEEPLTPEQPAAAVQPPDFEKMITARVFIKPGSENDFLAAARVIIENTLKEEGCQSYSLYQDPFEKSTFIFVEKYKNQAAIDTHFAADYFKEFGTKTADMTAKPMEIKILDIAGEK